MQTRQAFSRDDPKRRLYVQHIIPEDSGDVIDILIEHKGSLYICGNRNLPKAVQGALIKSFQHRYDIESCHAQDMLAAIFLAGRVSQEVW